MKYKVTNNVEMLNEEFNLEEYNMTNDDYGNDYIDDLLIQEKYDQATAFIHSQLKRLTTIDYNLLVSIYIEYLENLSPVIR